MKDDAGLEGVACARARVEQARTELQDAVARARALNRTWAQIGEVLGMTRQAAFKRFGSPRDPRTGGTMRPTPTTPDLIDRTEQVFRLIDAGDYDTLLPLMTKDTAEILTRDVVLDTWARVIADTGNLTDCSDTGLELPDGTPLDTGEAVHGTLVGHTIVDCEAGQWIGRVTYDPDRRIVGLLIVPTDSATLPS